MTTQVQFDAPSHLNARHQHTYEAIFRHPAAHNLEWHDVRSLLGALAEVAEGKNGTLKVTRNGQTVVLHVPKHKDVATVDDLVAIRHFLDKSAETTIASPIARGFTCSSSSITTRRKSIVRCCTGPFPQQIVPYDPHGFDRHLRSENPETDGKRQPERKSYYEAIVATLRDADEILILGSGTGESTAPWNSFWPK